MACTAPSDKFLYMGGPLAMGFGAVFMASLGSAFLPPTSAMGAGLYSISLYGGLVLFSGFMLYNTQKIIYRAERHPQYGMQKYDPINNCKSFTLQQFIFDQNDFVLFYSYGNLYGYHQHFRQNCTDLGYGRWKAKIRFLPFFLKIIHSFASFFFFGQIE